MYFIQQNPELKHALLRSLLLLYVLLVIRATVHERSHCLSRKGGVSALAPNIGEELSGLVLFFPSTPFMSDLPLINS